MSFGSWLSMFGGGTERRKMLRRVHTRTGKLRAGIVLGGKDGKIARDRTMTPTLVIGPTECGKTSCVAYPTAFEYDGSMVIWSFKGTDIEDIGKARERFGPVIYVTLGDRSTSRINPLMWVRPDHLVPDCQYIARKFVEREREGVWKNASFAFLTGVFIYLLTAAPDSEKNFAGAYRMVLEGDKALKKMLQPGVHKSAQNAAKTLWDDAIKKADEQAKKEKEEAEQAAVTGKPVKASPADRVQDRSQGIRRSVYFTCITLLADFEDDVLARQTSHNDFFPSDLVDGDRPVTLFVGSDPMISQRLPHVFAVIITMLVDFLSYRRGFTETGKPKQHECLGMFDEFLMLHLDRVKEWIKYTREMGFRLLMLGQTMWETEEEYGRGLTGNCITIEFKPRNATEANYIQQLAADRHKEIMVMSETERPGELVTASVNYSQRMERRPLITAADAMRMDGTCFVFGLGDPIELDLLPAYDQPQWKHLYGPSEGTWGERRDRNRWYGHINPEAFRADISGDIADADFTVVSEGQVENLMDPEAGRRLTPPPDAAGETPPDEPPPGPKPKRISPPKKPRVKKDVVI